MHRFGFASHHVTEAQFKDFPLSVFLPVGGLLKSRLQRIIVDFFERRDCVLGCLDNRGRPASLYQAIAER